MTPDTERATDDTQLLRDFFSTLDEHSILYAIVGDTHSLPHVPPNDIDIICSPGAFSQLRKIIRSFALEHDGNIVQILQHEYSAFYYVIWFPDKWISSNYLKIDVCTDYVRNGRLFLEARWLLEGRKINEHKGFYVAAPSREFAYYLLKKIDKGDASADGLYHLRSLLGDEPHGCRLILDLYFPPLSAKLIERAILALDWHILSSSITKLQKQLRNRVPGRSALLVFYEIKRYVTRLLNPTGFVVAILGPDGSGKSALLERLAVRLAPLGRRNVQYHFIPRFKSDPKKQKVVTNPHGRKPRGLVTSLLKIFYLLVLIRVRWIFLIWPTRLKSGTVYFDRYYHDIIVDPLRYRIAAPSWIVQCFGRLIPKPDIFLILDISPELARARKTEVSQKESERQFFAYREMERILPNAHIIDANAPLDKMIKDSEQAILNNIAYRKNIIVDPP